MQFDLFIYSVLKFYICKFSIFNYFYCFFCYFPSFYCLFFLNFQRLVSFLLIILFNRRVCTYILFKTSFSFLSLLFYLCSFIFSPLVLLVLFLFWCIVRLCLKIMNLQLWFQKYIFGHILWIITEMSSNYIRPTCFLLQKFLFFRSNLGQCSSSNSAKLISFWEKSRKF